MRTIELKCLLMLHAEEKEMTQYHWPDAPSQAAFPIAKAGYPFIFAAAFATAVFALLGFAWLAVTGLLVAGFSSLKLEKRH